MKKVIILIALTISPLILWSQSIGINNTGTTPEPSAMLDIQSTDKGVLIPRMTAVQRIGISDPADGLLVFDIDTTAFFFYDGANWKNLTTQVKSEIVDGDEDTKIQVEATADEDTIRVTIAGTEMLKLDDRHMHLDSGEDNIYIGKDVAPNGALAQNNIGIGPRVFKSIDTADENIAIGADVMAHAIHVDEVIAIGDSSMHMTGKDITTSSTLGGRNIAIGVKSGFNNISGSRNMFLGHRSGFDNASGFGNTMVGYFSGVNNTTGNNNTILGAYAGFDNTIGRGNVFIGEDSGDEVTTGDYNTIIGSSAGHGYITGNKSVFLGYNAGFDETQSERLYIENSDSPSPLIYGEFDNDLLRINGTLEINNEYQFPTTDGAANQVLQTDGAGVLLWHDLLTNEITEMLDTDDDTGIRAELTDDIDRLYYYVGGTVGYVMRKNENNVVRLETQDNILIGGLAGSSLAPSGTIIGNRNIYIGKEVGEDATITSNNVGIGYRAMEEITTGSQNTAVGQSALENSTTSGNNAAFGQSALSAVGLGSNNTGVGTRAGQNNPGTNNVFFGSLAGSNSTGNENVIIGTQSGSSTDGDNNTFVGHESGSLALGNNNLLLGYESGHSSSGDGNVFLGYQAGFSAAGSNKLYIENSNSNSPLIYGEFDNNLVKINGELNINGDLKMGINYSLPSTWGDEYSLLMSKGFGQETEWSYLTIPSTPGNNGQILKRNAGNGFAWSSDNVNDADSDPTNELQDISVIGNQLTLSSGSTVTVPSVWNESSNDIFYNSGRVSIGTSFADNPLSVFGSPINSELVDFSSTALAANQSLLNLRVASGSNDASHVIEARHQDDRLLVVNSNGQVIINNSSPESDYALTIKSISGAEAAIHTEGNSTFIGENLFQGESIFSGNTEFKPLTGSDHEIGIYPATTSAIGQSGIFLSGDYQGGAGHTIRNDSLSFKIVYEAFTAENERLRIDPFGRWSINEGAFILDPYVNGDSRFITDELEIRGGSDLAEKFDINETSIKPQAGMLVSIDPANPGQLMITEEANDRLLAGVISGANGIDPGMLMGQKGTIADGEYPVTLTGRVYVVANDEGGKITPGDLICSSSARGECMKAPKNLNIGACLGKALSGKDTKGFVLVLVNVR